MREIDRRRFLRFTSILIAAAATTDWAAQAEKDSAIVISIPEILQKYPAINPGLAAVNWSCVPDSTNRWTNLHHPAEPLFLTLPENRILYQERTWMEKYTQGFAEAIKRGQPTYLIAEIPHNPKNFSLTAWVNGTQRTASEFTGATAFIIGNEINNGSSPWAENLDNYFQIYRTAYETVKNFSPKSLVLPWQEAYFGHGEVLEQFLRKGAKIDGLPINFYDLSGKMEERVSLYHQILNRYGYKNIPIIMSECGLPEPTKDKFSPIDQANLVLQNLATAAYLINNRSLKTVAWYSALAEVDSPHALAFSYHDNFCTKPAFTAFVLAQHLLSGDYIELQRSPEGLATVKVFTQNSLTAIIMWNETNKNVSLAKNSFIEKIISPDGTDLSDQKVITINNPKNAFLPGETIVSFGNKKQDI